MGTKAGQKSKHGVVLPKAGKLAGSPPAKVLPKHLSHAHAQVANRTNIARRAAESAVRRKQQRKEPKTKLSVAIDPELLAWTEEYAESQQQSLSAVIGEALLRFKHNRGLVRLLEHLGGTDDISQGERDTFEAEMRKAGVGE